MSSTPTTHHEAPTRPLDARTVALAGARDALPVALGLVPFALAIGATIGASSMPAAAGWAGAPLIFAGSAQLSAIEMLERGAAPAVIVLSALALNARLVVYSAGATAWFGSASRRKRLLLAAPLVDPLYLVCAARFARGDLDERGREAYYWGATGVMAFAWVSAQGLALVAGASLPAALGLHIAAPLALAGLVAKSLGADGARAAAATSGVVAVLAVSLPLQSAIVVAMVAGVVAGTRVRRNRSR